jgi:phosphate:Na+ symporter
MSPTLSLVRDFAISPAMFTQLLGGIGLFLLGMLLLTDGLKAAAGDALKRVLVRFTGRPVSAFFSGLTLTALVQSSSATTLATIGFVSAGLLTFAQAIGIVIGGSVGTTTTGWLVSLLGLKLSVGKLALPFIGIGALMRLVLKGRASALGLALAGFGLIFVGIDLLQSGMGGLAQSVRPDSFPQATVLGRLVLVLIGVVMTVVMQSSSAAIATIITAFHAGTLNLDQALSLVIGASIGTTVTAALASIGASVPARRTALAHIIFNSFAGLLGFLVEPIFALAVRRLEARGDFVPGALSLAVFHTSFNLLGAVIVLPAVHRLARLVTRLVPDRGPALTRHLDDSLMEVPEVAIEAVRRTLVDCAGEVLAALRPRLDQHARSRAVALTAAQGALHDARAFLGRVPPFLPPAGKVNPRLAVVHALDHLDRLVSELTDAAPPTLSSDDARLEPARARLQALLETAGDLLAGAKEPKSFRVIEGLAAEVADLRRTGRSAILEETALGGLTPERAANLLDVVRSMDSTAYHVWRITHHLGGAEGAPDIGEASETRPLE